MLGVYAAEYQPPRHRIAIGVDGHQPIVGHDALTAQGLKEARLVERMHPGSGIAREAVDRSLVRVAAHAQIGPSASHATSWSLKSLVAGTLIILGLLGCTVIGIAYGELRDPSS